jgi:hypothetical protein
MKSKCVTVAEMFSFNGMYFERTFIRFSNVMEVRERERVTACLCLVSFIFGSK